VGQSSYVLSNPKVKAFLNPWYWGTLKVYVITLVLLLIGLFCLSLYSYLEPAPITQSVSSTSAEGAYASFLQMFSSAANGVGKVSHFIFFLIIVAQGILLFTLLSLMTFILNHRRWILVLFIPLHLLMSAAFLSEEHFLLTLGSLGISIIAVVALFKVEEFKIYMNKED